jgi:4'-phosphopantetheinyl transferase
MTRNATLLTRRLLALWPKCSGASILSLRAEAMWRRLAEESRAASGVWVVVAAHAAMPDNDRSSWSTEDCERAARCTAPERQRAFAAGRLMLHRLLSRDTAMPLHFNAHGKPMQPSAAHFNVSHTLGHTVLAICATGPVGVDIECTQRLEEPLSLVDLVAHPNEALLLRQASVANLPALFLRCWTRKEALLKAWGCGLTVPLQSVDTRLDEPAPHIDARGGWQLLDASLPQLNLALAIPSSVASVTLSIVQVLDQADSVASSWCFDRHGPGV